MLKTTCQAHGAAGFTNLLVTKEGGFIVLNPHLGNCCVLRLDEQVATALYHLLGNGWGMNHSMALPRRNDGARRERDETDIWCAKNVGDVTFTAPDGLPEPTTEGSTLNRRVKPTIREVR